MGVAGCGCAAACNFSGSWLDAVVMSLINRVLNDLEKRGASTNIGEATIRVVPLRQQRGWLWLILAAVAVLVLAATAWMKWGAETKIKAPQLVLTAVPAPVELQPASQPLPVAAAEVRAELPPPDTGFSNKLSIASSAVVIADKPLLPLPPAILAVSPNPATSLNVPQDFTITGSNFVGDASVTLRTPEGKMYSKRKIMAQDPARIVISANFGNIAGPWSVEVVNAGGQASGQFTFVVHAASAVATVPAPKKSALAAVKESQGDAKPVTVVIPASGISKQPTQMTLPQQAENEFRKAYALMQQGQTNAAISGYEKTLQLDAGHLVARQTLVRLLLDNRRNADAERVLQEGLQFDPKQHSLAMLLARMQVGRNELAQALDTMQKSLPYAQQQADYQAFLAALLQRQNRHKEAIVYFQNAVQLSPQSGVWLMGLGISLRAEQRNAEARDAFNRAMGARNLSAELQAFVTQQLKEL
jgi:MSHA biogenesis protein MshN